MSTKTIWQQGIDQQNALALPRVADALEELVREIKALRGVTNAPALAPTDIITAEQLAKRWETTTGALAQMRYRGIGPMFTRVGPKTIRYRMADVLAHEENSRVSRSDEVADGGAA